ncbi:MAG: hypothetical protein FWG63_00195 [Defluviitaleaceae bacterium]|nr:hypothetical protein [Defluviitaleaceae bacterium]
MPTTKASQKAVNKYMKNNYDSLRITVYKGKKETLKAHAAEKGESLNGFVNRAIDNQVKADNEGS